MMSQRVLITLLLWYYTLAQLQIDWNPCTQYSYTHSYDVNASLGPLIAECANTTVRYINDDPTSFNISYAIKRYRSPSSQGSIIVLGDSIVGNSGSSIEVVGYSLYTSLNQNYDVVLPSFRGTGASGYFPCDGYLGSYGRLSAVNCQMPNTIYGDNYPGFSVDEIAKDTLNLVRTLKQGLPMYILGRGFGSYVLHRMLQIDNSLIDAIIMDGVCAGPFCNATDWDVQRNIMGRNIASQLPNMTSSSVYLHYSAQGYDIISLYTTMLRISASSIPICGRDNSIPWNDIYKEIVGFCLLDQTCRPKIFASNYQMQHCVNMDFATGFGWYHDIVGAPQYGAFKYYYNYIILPTDCTFVSTHITLSELLVPNITITDSNLLFSERMWYYIDAMRAAGWKTYPSSPLRNSIATFNKPMLMLNGNLDPQAPLSSVRQFASYFNATNQMLVVMPGMSSDTIMKSYVRNDNITCGMKLVIQFITCPNCTLDTSCTSDMIGLSLDGDQNTLLYFGNVYNTFYVPPLSSYIGRSVVCAITTPLPIIILIFLIIFYKNRRVRSRSIGPYLGLAYIETHLIYNAIRYGAQWSALPYLPIAVIVQEVLIVLSCTVFSIQAARFFLLSIIYRRMSRSLPSGRLMKFLTSKVLYFIVITSVLVVWLIFGIIMIALEYTYGYYVTEGPYTYTSIAVAATLAFITFLFLIYDVLAHAITTRCNITDYFYIGDPLLFRIDNILVPFIIIFAVIGNVVTDIITIIILDEISILLMCLYFGGTLCIAAIVDKIRGITMNVAVEHKSNDDSDEVREMLFSDIGEPYFQRYCASEFSLENVLAWKKLQEISANPGDNTQLEKFFEDYLRPGSDYELNVSAKLYNKIKTMIETNTISQEERARNIEELSDTIMSNLLDTFGRYRITNEYAECKRAMSVSKQIKNRIE